MNTRNVKLVVEYKGTMFSGWQIQRGQATVQQELTDAVKRVTGKTVEVVGAGRTDAGVHALGQVANFHIEHGLEPGRYRDALNFYLPPDIRVKSSNEVLLSFHARFDAKWRRYRYILSNDKSALFRELRWETEHQINFDQLQDASRLVVGEHDFGSFCVVASRKPDNRCSIEYSRWFRVGPLLVYEIRGNRFLHSMVRSLVGAMMNIAKVRPDNNMLNLTLAEFADIISGQREERMIFTAPPHGLYLVAVGY